MAANIKFKNIDHLVLTTQDLDACLHFYGNVLGMTVDKNSGRYAIKFGNQKFNIHTRKAEFLPAAKYPAYGSLDLCLIVDGNIEDVKKEIISKEWPIELGPVARHGTRGEMQSIYLRDPDGNLIELSSYQNKFSRENR